MNIIFSFVIFFACAAYATDQNQIWLEKHMATMDSISEYSIEDQIEALGQLVRIGNEKMNDDQKMIYERAQKLLLAIPGHAEFYEKRINEAEKEVKAAMGTDDFWPKMHQYKNESMYGFRTLGQLPSPETVRVVGDFLFNDWASELPKHEDGTDIGGVVSAYALEHFK